MRRTTRFRHLVEAPQVLRMPGIYDALSARLAEAAGFPAVMMGGFAATGSLLGAPDISQLSLTELSEHTARICDAVGVPVFIDGDTGFGNTSNVARTVKLLERAGVGGLFIEDQVFPKRCGHTAGKAVIPTTDMIGKVKAAVDARVDDDLVIMARTDALAVNGMDDAIERINLYREAGADLLFVEAPRNQDDMRQIIARAPGHHMANMVEFGLSPTLSGAELSDIGYSVAIWPVAAILAVTRTLQGLFADLHDTDSTNGLLDRMVSFSDYTNFVGLQGVRDEEQRYILEAESLYQRNKPAAQ